MECLNCAGTLRVGKASYVVNRNDYHLIIDNVPAFICDQCGLPLFTEETVQLVQTMIRAGAHKNKTRIDADEAFQAINYLEQRAARGSREKLLELLTKAPDAKPEDRDKL